MNASTSNPKPIQQPLEEDKEQQMLSDNIDSRKNYTRLSISSEDKLSPNKESTPDFQYQSFNPKNYQEVYPSKLSKLNPFRAEMVYQSTIDQSKIIIKSKKVILDNTPDNMRAALDIAVDKGWKKIKIKGADKQSQAQLWFLAQLKGLQTSGYKPSKGDLMRLEQAKAEQNQGQDIDIKPIYTSPEQSATTPQTHNLDKNTPKPKQEAKSNPTQTHEPPQQTAQTNPSDAPSSPPSDGVSTHDLGIQPSQSAPEKAPSAPINPVVETPERARSKKREDENKETDNQHSKSKETPHTQQYPQPDIPAHHRQLLEQESTLSRNQYFAHMQNEIMAEVQRVMPLDEKSYNDLQNQVDRSLAIASQKGKVDVKKVTQSLQKTLPIVRGELGEAARNEQRKAQAEKVKTKTEERGR